jgi:hypothetical protein
MGGGGGGGGGDFTGGGSQYGFYGEGNSINPGANSQFGTNQTPLFGNNFGQGNYAPFTNADNIKSKTQGLQGQQQMWNENFNNNSSFLNSQQGAFNVPDYNKNKKLLFDQFNNWQGKSLDQLSPYRTDQTALIKMLQDRAAGNGPSVAQLQLQQGQENNLSQLMAARQSMGGNTNAGLQQREFGTQQGAMNQSTNAQSAILRAQEMAQAQQLLGGTIAQGRSGDLATNAMQNSMVQYYLSQGLDLNAAQAASHQAYQSLIMGQYQAANLQQNAFNNQQNQLNQQLSASNQNAAIGAGGAIIGGVAGGLLSDETKKKEIEPASKDIQEFLNALKDYKYEYKNPKFGVGKHISVMAQDLEKSSVGKSMVLDTPEGKMVHYGKGLGLMLAAQAHLNARINKMEAENG